MTNQAIDIAHAKLRGEWAELRFMSRAAEHGLTITKPWGDSARYDFAVEHRGRFLRVQVKSTRCRRWNSYVCQITANGTPYSPDQLDFIAAYVIPADTWYIIPTTASQGQQTILLTPDRIYNRKHCKFDAYKEAWHLLRTE